MVRTSQNNGLRGYINENPKFLNSGNTIAFGQDTATVFYQEVPYFTGDKIKVLKAIDSRFNKHIAQFLLSALAKGFSSFSWGSSSFSINVLENTLINIPTKNNQPDFEFMEQFIGQLEQGYVQRLDDYLSVTGFHDIELTDSELHVLADFESWEWGEFKISNIFRKLNLKNHNKLFDKKEDTSTFQNDEFNIPLVNAKVGDNGIMFYGRESDFDTAEMTIDVISNGAIATGTVYAQPYKVGVLWDAYLLKVKDQNMTKQKLLCLTACLEKAIKLKFGWDNKAVWSKVQHENIQLPITANQPDFSKMETLISALQKLVIREVVNYTDERLQVTEAFAC